jgi:hypothetical protein
MVMVEIPSRHADVQEFCAYETSVVLAYRSCCCYAAQGLSVVLQSVYAVQLAGEHLTDLCAVYRQSSRLSKYERSSLCAQALVLASRADRATW